VYRLNSTSLSYLGLSGCLLVLGQLSDVFGIHELLNARNLSPFKVEDKQVLVRERLVQGRSLSLRGDMDDNTVIRNNSLNGSVEVQGDNQVLQVLEPVQELGAIADWSAHSADGSWAEFMGEFSSKETCESIEIVRVDVLEVLGDDFGGRHCRVDRNVLRLRGEVVVQ